MRDEDLEIRVVGRHVVDQHRVAVLDLQAATARRTRAEGGVPPVKDDGNPEVLDGRPQLLVLGVGRVEPLGDLLELEPGEIQILDAADRLLDAIVFERIDGAESDEEVGMLVADLGDVVVRHGRITRVRLRVPAEQHGPADPGRPILLDHVFVRVRLEVGAEPIGCVPHHLSPRVVEELAGRLVSVRVDRARLLEYRGRTHTTSDVRTPYVFSHERRSRSNTGAGDRRSTRER